RTLTVPRQCPCAGAVELRRAALARARCVAAATGIMFLAPERARRLHKQISPRQDSSQSNGGCFISEQFLTLKAAGPYCRRLFISSRDAPARRLVRRARGSAFRPRRSGP